MLEGLIFGREEMEECARFRLGQGMATQSMAYCMDHFVEIQENLLWSLAGLELAIEQLHQFHRRDGFQVLLVAAEQILATDRKPGWIG